MDDRNDSCDYFTVEPESNPESLHQWLSIVENGKTTATRRSDISPKAKRHLSLGWRFAYFPRKNNKREVRYKSPKGKWFPSLASACSSCLHDGSVRELIVPESESPRNLLVAYIETNAPKKKKRTRKKDCETMSFNVSKAIVSVDVLKKRKRANVCETAAFSGTKAIVNVAVLKKRKRVNNCDTTAFNGVALNKEKNRLSNVTKVILRKRRVNDTETAAFNPLSDLNVDVINQQQKKKRMAAASFNVDVRPRYEKSLRKVLEVMEKKNKKCEKESVRFWKKDCGPEKNCDVCCVCHYGGDLLLCDGCPSAFHHTCIGLPNLPEEELWFCSRCCCDICGSMVTLGNSKLMTCEQCQRRFHLKCLKQEEASCLVSVRGWFCGKQCSRVFSAFQSLLGRRIEVGEEGLVWSLIRAPSDGEHYDDEQMSKLDSAVEILHQGFEPSTDPFSGRDLVEDLILRKDADGVGRGFYTVLIERNNEPVTVAAVRVKKDVAEIPLVATLFRRLVLPTARDGVSTWSQGFRVQGDGELGEVGVCETWDA